MRSKRVLLIQPPVKNVKPDVFPLGLAQLSGVLRQRHDVRGFDGCLEPDAELAPLVRSHAPEIIGVSFRNCDTARSYDDRSFVPELEENVRRLRRMAPDSIIAVGGAGFSLFPEVFMDRLPEIDIGFEMEADRSFPAFVDDPDRAPELPGVYYRKDGAIRHSGPGERVDLSSVPLPDFELFRPAQYNERSPIGVGLESKRGCPCRCIYCVYPHLSGRETRPKSEDRIAEEAERLVRAGVRSFLWVDSTFNLPRGHAEAVARTLIRHCFPIRWGAFFTGLDFDEGFHRLIYDAGCRQFFVTQDGISEKTLRTMGKPGTVSDYKRTYRLTRQHRDSGLHVSFLLGTPGESVGDLLRFVQMLLFLVFRVWRFSLGLSFVRVYPNSRIHQIAVEQGVISEENDLLTPFYFTPFPSRLLRRPFHFVFRLATRRFEGRLLGPRTAPD